MYLFVTCYHNQKPICVRTAKAKDATGIHNIILQEYKRLSLVVSGKF